MWLNKELQELRVLVKVDSSHIFGESRFLRGLKSDDWDPRIKSNILGKYKAVWVSLDGVFSGHWIINITIIAYVSKIYDKKLQLEPNQWDS